jgi:hypothetical protein
MREHSTLKAHQSVLNHGADLVDSAAWGDGPKVVHGSRHLRWRYPAGPWWLRAKTDTEINAEVLEVKAGY